MNERPVRKRKISIFQKLKKLSNEQKAKNNEMRPIFFLPKKIHNPSQFSFL